MTDKYLLQLTIHGLSCLKTSEKLLLGETAGSAGELGRMPVEHIEMIIGRKFRSKVHSPGAALVQAERCAEILEKLGIGVVNYWDPLYPVQLKEIWNPPYLLFYRGELPDNEMPMVGVVGTRYPSGGGRNAAYILGVDIGSSGLWLVSGLARGIDGAAHAGCVKGKGKTCAVLGSGIDTVYPKEHKKLALAILESGGALLSEYPPRTQPTRYTFPERNRIISGLSRGIVVVEAPVKSGALITADFALEQGRDLFVHSGGMGGHSGEGTRRLYMEGAVSISAFRDILADWGCIIGNPAPRERGDIDWTRQAGQILSKLLEKELAEDLFYYQGECIRSKHYG